MVSYAQDLVSLTRTQASFSLPHLTTKTSKELQRQIICPQDVVTQHRSGGFNGTDSLIQQFVPTSHCVCPCVS